MTAEITKISVGYTQPKLYSITLRLRYLDDGEVEVLNQTFTQKYRTGQDVNVIIERFRDPMQKAIDDYNLEQSIFTSAQLDSAIVTLQGNLTP